MCTFCELYKNLCQLSRGENSLVSWASSDTICSVVALIHPRCRVWVPLAVCLLAEVNTRDTSEPG